MSGLSMPPAEPPSDDVLEVVDRLRAARMQLDEARRQERLLQTAIDESVGELPRASLDYLRTERRVASNRTLLWRRNVRALETRARALGVRP